MWTLREIKVRYKQSILGASWAVLQPLSLTIIFTVVFSYITRVASDDFPYPVLAYTALLPWTLFTSAISSASPSLLMNMALVTKIYFPKEILPLSFIGTALLDFAIGVAVFAGMLLLYQIPVHSSMLWFPVILITQIFLMIGICLLASAVNVFYRDIRFVVPLALQLWLYASPIIYPLNIVPKNLFGIYILNPMVGIIEGYRKIFLYGESPVSTEFLISVIASFGIAIFGYLFFKKKEPEFADII